MEMLAEIHLSLKPAVPIEELERHVRINASLGRPFLLGNKYDLRDEPLAIVAGGPSLKSTIEELRSFKNVMVCGTAHDYLIAKGIAPTFAVHCDQAADLHAFQNKSPDIQYLIGTNVNPDLVRHLHDCPVLLWDTDGWMNKEVYQGRGRINGGSTAACRAPALGTVLGFKEFHLFGVDSCFEDNRDRHAYEYEDERLISPSFTCDINGRRFQTTFQFMQQARDYQTLLTHYGHLFTVEVHGESLMRDVVLDAQKNLEQFWNTRKAIKREKAA